MASLPQTAAVGVSMMHAFEHAFAHAAIGMALVDMDGRFLRVNDSLCRITGYPRAQLEARSLRELSHAADVDLDAAQIARVVRGDLTSYQIERRYLHADGHDLWALLTVSLVRDDRHRPLYFISQLQDISERKELERHLEHLVDHDFLTGLLNGRHFQQALTHEVKVASRYGGGGAVLLIDLDNFKDVNDQFGHKAGDDLLKTVATELRARIRSTDILARLGGDEFGIILPQADEERAQVVAQGIVKAVARHSATLAEQRIAITASVGIAAFGFQTDVEILAGADVAMYDAKAAGRNAFAVYRPQSGALPRRTSRLAEAERIQHALAHDRLVLYCQPIVDLSTNEVSQYELLLRLRNEHGDLLAPSAFLYVAERFGTIRSIDRWVVQQAIALLADQARAGRSTRFHVNISAKSIGDVALIEAIDRALTDAAVDPARLVLELTETAAIGNIDNAKTFTNAMRSRGCRLALDDFGSGFGSFYYLKHLPFDYFKIDGDFIRGCAANPTDQLVIEAIVGIARGLGKKTVAEFVTDRAMTDRLRRCGIDYAQGYYIGEPRPVAETLARL
jgi:diguanylate cyclase (GGDEF)-like protein/PAS domain S-box-containing protein